MPDRCVTCDNELDQERIFALIKMNRARDKWDCTDCAAKTGIKYRGFMTMSGEHGCRKVAPELTVIDPTSPNYKENLRMAIAVSERRR